MLALSKAAAPIPVVVIKSRRVAFFSIRSLAREPKLIADIKRCNRLSVNRQLYRINFVGLHMERCLLRG